MYWELLEKLELKSELKSLNKDGLSGIQALLGGHQTYVVMNIPGGVRKGLLPAERDEIVNKAKVLLSFQSSA
jgi:coenzyme F420-reducing hydrogenase alpha subunit